MTLSADSDLVIRPEEAGDAAAVRAVNEAAFGRRLEADIVDALRAVGAVVLSVVAETDGKIVAHVLYSPAVIHAPGGPLEILSLGPVAVLPAWQRRGMGTRLVEASLDHLRVAGHSAVVVIGHPGYYPRFGFTRGSRWDLAVSPAIGCEVPDEAFMVVELQAGSLAGVTGEVEFRPEFAEG